MNKLERKKLKNKRYYEKHKARILEKRKRADGMSTTPPKKSITGQPRTSERVLISPRNKQKSQKSIGVNFERIFILGLVILTTLFLIRETAHYLSQADGGLGLVKALIVEGLILALSWLKFGSLRLKLARFSLLFALFVLNLWAISGTAVSANETQINRAESVARQISEIETAIHTKENLRLEARSTDRQTLARKYEREIDQLRFELNSARAERLKVQSPGLTKIQTIQAVLFRLVVMAANALLVSQLAGLKRRKTQPEAVFA